jgi:hypothetical protein
MPQESAASNVNLDTRMSSGQQEHLSSHALQSGSRMLVGGGRSHHIMWPKCKQGGDWNWRWVDGTEQSKWTGGCLHTFGRLCCLHYQGLGWVDETSCLLLFCSVYYLTLKLEAMRSSRSWWIPTRLHEVTSQLSYGHHSENLRSLKYFPFYNTNFCGSRFCFESHLCVKPVKRR